MTTKAECRVDGIINTVISPPYHYVQLTSYSFQSWMKSIDIASASYQHGITHNSPPIIGLSVEMELLALSPHQYLITPSSPSTIFSVK